MGLKLASKYGCKHVFTCLLSVEGSREKIIHHFRESIALAHSYGMEVMLDTAPSVFQALGASYDDLSFFKELGADGIRLEAFGEKHVIHQPEPLDPLQVFLARVVLLFPNGQPHHHPSPAFILA